MKGYRRNRPLYLSPSVSSDYDRRTDFDELARIDRLSRGRCGSRLVQSIAKLNCGAPTPKAETLMSQSDFTFENLETDNRYLNQPMIDPVLIYPSFVALAPGSSVQNVQVRSRRREDDSSDDALTAPRRFVSPSKLRSDYRFKDRSNKIKSAFSGCTGIVVLVDDSIPEKHTVQMNVTPYAFDVPECVVIPSMVESSEKDFTHGTTSSNIPSNSPVSPYRDLDETLFVRIPEFITSFERNSLEHAEAVEKWDDSSSHTSDRGHSELGQPCNVDCEKACTRTHEYSVPGYHLGFQRLPSSISPVNDDMPQCSRAPHLATDHDWLNQKITDDAKRTFFLASSSQETPKVSSLSTKLRSHQRNISLQSSDTSYGTTKSGATLSTSHSTATGLSRSSRKTQALIERFDRHITAQKALERWQNHNPI
jgi:hypothetical protein